MGYNPAQLFSCPNCSSFGSCPFSSLPSEHLRNFPAPQEVQLLLDSPCPQLRTTALCEEASLY